MSDLNECIFNPENLSFIKFRGVRNRELPVPTIHFQEVGNSVE